ncbi:PaxB protein [Purpureocillium lavendulum]|uniref:PaxB protein n=1 Tax=Purpureocillium lavendulum TaxID=1247861 RepID=A0AB34FPQ9_9HYPO|nr:PaxB protein [Purpureocillium lavendulum]
MDPSATNASDQPQGQHDDQATPRPPFTMFGVNFGSLRGIGMVVLQVLRVFTVITLAAVGASCWILIIKVDKGRDTFVFECASHFFTSMLCIVLIVAEFPFIGLVRRYFERTWPVLSPAHGLGWLGFAMAVIGCNMLGNLNRPAYDPDNMGSNFAKLVLASSVLAVTFGVINILCALVWRDGKEGVTSRDIRADGAVANSHQHSLPDYTPSARTNSSLRNEKTRSKFVSMFWKKGDDGEKTRPHISGPFQAHHDVERDAAVDEDRRSPIVPKLKRPDTALHPMHTGRSSHYSTAHMSRF